MMIQRAAKDGGSHCFVSWNPFEHPRNVSRTSFELLAAVGVV